MAVYNFGSINIDHVYTVPHFVAPGETLSSSKYSSVLGGKGANQSIACAQAGAAVKHVGNVHASDQAFVEAMQTSGVNCELVKHVQTATGHAIIQVNEQGENAIVLYPGANHEINDKQINQALANADSNDWVLLQNETNDIANIIAFANQKGLQIAFNPAPMTPDVAKLALKDISLLIVNEIEAMQLTNTQSIENAKAALSEQFSELKVVLTLGKSGVCYLHQSTCIEVSSFSVEAVDTTAAGDTFIGYFLASFMSLQNESEANIRQALTSACAAAAICVTRAGAAPSIPFANEVKDFLNCQP